MAEMPLRILHLDARNPKITYARYSSRKFASIFKNFQPRFELSENVTVRPTSFARYFDGIVVRSSFQGT